MVGVEVREEVLGDPWDGAVAEGVHDERRVGDAFVERAGPLVLRRAWFTCTCKTNMTNKM